MSKPLKVSARIALRILPAIGRLNPMSLKTALYFLLGGTGANENYSWKLKHVTLRILLLCYVLRCRICSVLLL